MASLLCHLRFESTSVALRAPSITAISQLGVEEMDWRKRPSKLYCNRRAAWIIALCTQDVRPLWQKLLAANWSRADLRRQHPRNIVKYAGCSMLKTGQLYGVLLSITGCNIDAVKNLWIAGMTRLRFFKGRRYAVPVFRKSTTLSHVVQVALHAEGSLIQPVLSRLSPAVRLYIGMP